MPSYSAIAGTDSEALQDHKPAYSGFSRQPIHRRFSRKCWIGTAVLLAIAVAIAIGVSVSKSDDSGNSPSQPAIWQNIRLPDSVVPSAYDLFLHPNISTFDYTGRVKVSVSVLKSTKFILIHSVGHNFTDIDITADATGDAVPIRSYFTYAENEFLVIELKNSAPVANYTLDISFVSVIRSDLTGFYRSSYLTSTGERRWIATTQFEPVDARRAFPCFDEPAMKATFKLTMVKDHAMTALGNMPIASTTPSPTNPSWDVVEFENSVRMSTYLVAFVVCDFVSVTSTTPGGVVVSIWTPPEIISQAEVALNVSAAILAYYESFFGVPYPLPKSDLIAIPDFNAGAMENWGLITYRETALLVDPAASSASNVQRVVTVIAHELAHQWFGNLVTMEWWNDLWLNEGFASFVEYIGVSSVRPEWDMDTQFFVLAQKEAFSLDALESSHPIEAEVTNPGEISELFDAISYDKGASVIRMLFNVMGEANFLAGIKSYLLQHQFANAQTNDLWASLSQFTTLDVRAIMHSWTSQVGFPVLTATPSNDGSTVHIVQKRFLADPSAQPDLTTLWAVPISRTDSSGAQYPVTWIEDAQHIIPLTLPAGGWYLFNVNRTAFFRVNYDAVNWARLGAALLSNPSQFSASDRAGILDDAFTFARAGVVPFVLPLNLTAFLSQELDYTVWSTAVSGLAYIGSQLRWQPSFGAFQDYFAKLVGPAANTLGWQIQASDPHMTLLARGLVLDAASRRADQIDAVGNATALFKAFMADPVNAQVPADLRDFVYLVGIAHGDRPEWDFMWEQYLQTTAATEQRRILRALASTRIPWLLNRLLAFSLDPTKIRSQDATTVVAYVASQTTGELVAWDWLRAHYDEYAAMLGGGSFSLGNFVSGVVAHFQTQQLYNDVQAFFAPKELGAAANAVAQSLESIRTNILWLAANQAQIEQFLGYVPA
ncbi:membrane alanine aminopeptidase [Capsaspora owczarzaki ATCC 30864]|uniref:Aminopeptidase n=1 Tax=Capsaspora owczarzaki (strain ATCC 30864) TaxID=595528 RepID=A0A0D2WL87_CAPO3|nr:membrane alanine aminopeptidase [Capsaspora owczarzaki ATCC 30864]KJE90548.1 membrane alanine aminopeptidase [Capsaspora owczarzaki ATCC 30864]|eukprot:XP_004364718.1 membrane alanine aminopeptidase [Capsaspora owczarzaki ATCC 30864]